jgi:hypothetical protein
MRKSPYAFHKFPELSVNSDGLIDRLDGIARQISFEITDCNAYERNLLAQIIMKLACQTATFLVLRIDQPGGKGLNLFAQNGFARAAPKPGP